jgi:BirA family biotin operon repressor/biotin-[acetyl-CoA-carboxylase] ligase
VDGPLTAATVEPLLRGSYGRPYVHREETASTQELAAGLPHGGVAACELQTAGRGRHARPWLSPRGKGLLFSLSLHPRRPVSELPALSLVAAEAVCEALPVAALVRWPNDVVVGDRKLAGVLPDFRAPALTLGIGLNANLAPEELPPPGRLAPTSLLVETGAPVDRARLLADVLESLEEHVARWERDGFTGLARDELRGRWVELADGTYGRCEGVDGAGRLVVGGRAFTSAEVTWVRASTAPQPSM